MRPPGCALVCIGERAGAEALGQLAKDLLSEQGFPVVGVELVSDDPARLKGLVVAALADPRIDVLLAIGGPERMADTVESLLERRLPGFAEVCRYLAYQESGSAAIYVHSCAGFVRSRVLIALPGSPEAVRRAMVKLVLPELTNLHGRARTG